MSQDSVTLLMNSRVISVLPDTPILAAIDILLTNNYNGIPVVDKKGAIVGILTKYDLIVNRNSIHDDMKAKDLMNRDPLILVENMTVQDAIQAFSEHHRVDPIPVVSLDRKVIGIISRYDMVKLFREYGQEFGVRENQSAPRKNKFSLWPMIILFGLALVAALLYFWGYF